MNIHSSELNISAGRSAGQSYTRNKYWQIKNVNVSCCYS